MNGILKAPDNEEVSLRPLSLRPGGAARNPFASFGKGAGAAFRDKPKEDIFAPPQEEKRKPRGEVIKYTAEFLHTLSEFWTKVPEPLQNFPDVLLDTTAGRPEIPPPQQAAEPADERDWRARQTGAPTGEAPAGANAQQAVPTPSAAKQQDGQRPQDKAAPAERQQRPQAPTQPAAAPAAAPAPSAPAAQAPGPLPAIQTAEELGRKAWVPNAALSNDEKAVRAVKGILNKLTPEKFDVLLAQLKSTIANTEILHSSISLVFENAVAQPTFVKMYADLCDRLSKELPDFEGGGAAGASRTFRRVLLNTCQEEFEGAAAAREALKSQALEDLEGAQRRVKLRTLGNIRLIAELFNKGVVAEKIVHACIADLLGAPKAAPVEDNAEAMCELLTASGKNLDAQTREKKRLDGYFSTLDRWTKSPALPARIRFLIRDVLELRRSQWVPRRETLQAKKITEIHAEAHAELGMVPASMMASLQALPAMQSALPGLQQEEIELFPAFKHSDEGWQMLGRKKEGAGGPQSALLGDYVDIPVPKAAEAAVEAAVHGQPATTTPPAPVAAGLAPKAEPAKPAAPSKPTRQLDEEGRKAAAKSILDEFVSSNDTAEAVTCLQEINSPGAGPGLMRVCIEFLLDLAKEREQEMVVPLLVALVQQGAVSKADLIAALQRFSRQLEDLSLDVPKAPQLLGALVGHAGIENVLDLGVLSGLCTECESVEPRREFAAHAFKYIQAKAGEGRLVELCEKAALKAGVFLTPDPEIDPPDLPSTEAFLSSKGLSAVPV